MIKIVFLLITGMLWNISLFPFWPFTQDSTTYRRTRTYTGSDGKTFTQTTSDLFGSFFNSEVLITVKQTITESEYQRELSEAEKNNIHQNLIIECKKKFAQVGSNGHECKKTSLLIGKERRKDNNADSAFSRTFHLVRSPQSQCTTPAPAASQNKYGIIYDV